MSDFVSRLRARPAVIAMLHAPPLPGAARAGHEARRAIDSARERVLGDARAALRGGADALLLENYGDAPFSPGRVAPHVVSMLTLLAAAVRAEIALPLGVNVLRNDARAALAVALAAGGHFVRVNVLGGVVATDQGIIAGQAERVLAYRRRLGADIAIVADVDVKHGRPLWGEAVADRAQDLVARAGADVLVVTGPATGRPPDLPMVEAVRTACPSTPLLVGSGVTAANAAELLTLADGVIVGTAIKEDGSVSAPVDEKRVAALVQAARAAWEGRGR